MAEYTVQYSELSLGIAVHGVITVVDDQGRAIASFEGLATKSNGEPKAIGSAILGDRIEAYVNPGPSPNAQSRPEIIGRGPIEDIGSVLGALRDTRDAINKAGTPYELPGIDSGIIAPSNSNSVVQALLGVLGLQAPTQNSTLLGPVGRGNHLLDKQTIESIRQKNGFGPQPAPGIPLPPERPSNLQAAPPSGRRSDATPGLSSGAKAALDNATSSRSNLEASLAAAKSNGQSQSALDAAALNAWLGGLQSDADKRDSEQQALSAAADRIRQADAEAARAQAERERQHQAAQAGSGYGSQSWGRQEGGGDPFGGWQPGETPNAPGPSQPGGSQGGQSVASRSGGGGPTTGGGLWDGGFHNGPPGTTEASPPSVPDPERVGGFHSGLDAGPYGAQPDPSGPDVPGETMVPVILDLDGDGLSIVQRDASTMTYDMAGDGLQHRTAWVGKGDGVLAIDADGDGKIDQRREIIFTDWDPGAGSDMKALRSVFDTNHNGRLDAGDARFADFRVVVDGQVRTLAELGIVSIDLVADGAPRRYADGSTIEGSTTFTRADGSTGTAADASFVSDADGWRMDRTSVTGADGRRTDTLTARAVDGTLVSQTVSVTSADGSETTTTFDDDHSLIETTRVAARNGTELSRRSTIRLTPRLRLAQCGSARAPFFHRAERYRRRPHLEAIHSLRPARRVPTRGRRSENMQ